MEAFKYQFVTRGLWTDFLWKAWEYIEVEQKMVNVKRYLLAFHRDLMPMGVDNVVAFKTMWTLQGTSVTYLIPARAPSLNSSFVKRLSNVQHFNTFRATYYRQMLTLETIDTVQYRN